MTSADVMRGASSTCWHGREVGTHSAYYMWVCHSPLPPPEVLITTPGEYVLPEPIEATLLEYIPFIGHAFVIGHTRQYLTCLFTIKVLS